MAADPRRRQEEVHRPARDFLGHLLQIQHPRGADRTFNTQIVALEMLVALRLDELIVHGHPERTAPVRIAVEFPVKRTVSHRTRLLPHARRRRHRGRRLPRVTHARIIPSRWQPRPDILHSRTRYAAWRGSGAQSSSATTARASRRSLRSGCKGSAVNGDVAGRLAQISMLTSHPLGTWRGNVLALAGGFQPVPSSAHHAGTRPNDGRLDP
jgi:hypothetical protein